MSRRVFLHIGLPKTGTTYLQDALWANQAELRSRGVLVPGRHRRRHLLASLDVREDPTLADRPGDVAAPWQDLVDEVNRAKGDALISHEFFAAASPDQVRRVVASFPGAELHPVVTARAMVNLGISRWQEWVKNGGPQDIDSYPVRDAYDPADEWGWGSFDLADILERWGSVVPHERIHVLPMASGRADPADLWRRFLSVLGLDPAGLDAPDSPANPSLGIVEIELLRRVTPHLVGFSSAMDRGTWIRGYLAEGGVMPALGERFRPDEATLAELVRRGERAVEMLHAGGYDVVGDLDFMRPGDVSTYRHPTEVTDAELLDAAVRTIATLTGEVRKLTRERKALSRGIGGSAVATGRDRVQPFLRRLGSRVPRIRRRM